MKVALLNCPECPCPGTHYHACMEFIDGFKDFGYEVSCATSIAGCVDKDILLLSDHNIDFSFLHTLYQSNPNAVYILWCYYNVIDRIPFKKFILTGEYYHYPPRLSSHIGIYNIGKSVNNFVPLMLRANDPPSKIGTYEKTHELNGCFMGTPYKPDWVSGLPNILYHNIQRGGCLSYDERRKIYLKSRIAFGFSDNINIANYHPTQRIFEGLAYGCVVISDNEAARDLTDGIVEYAANKTEFLEKYHYFLSHPDECEAKAQAGYEWTMKYGTNRYSASLFLEKIRELGF